MKSINHKPGEHITKLCPIGSPFGWLSEEVYWDSLRARSILNLNVGRLYNSRDINSSLDLMAIWGLAS
jgi:hypothetical protein